MAKIKRSTDIDCTDVLYPLGRGLPLCAYPIIQAHRLAEAKLQDFPMCDPKHCPKEVAKKKQEGKTI